MNSFVILTLCALATPFFGGLLLIRWNKKGYLQTPKWLAECDRIMHEALPGGGSRNPNWTETGQNRRYVFPTSYPQLKIGRFNIRPKALNDFLADFQFTYNQALENWD